MFAAEYCKSECENSAEYRDTPWENKCQLEKCSQCPPCRPGTNHLVALYVCVYVCVCVCVCVCVWSVAPQKKTTAFNEVLEAITVEHAQAHS